MSEQHIVRLENQLEHLVEGAFRRFFGKKLRAQDIALELSRAVVEGAKPISDQAMLAADKYIIFIAPETHQHLLQHQPKLARILAQYVIEVAASADYRLNREPLVRIIADAALTAENLVVKGEHSDKRTTSTALMPPRGAGQAPQDQPRNPQLLLNGVQSIPLSKAVVNIGRGHENEIILDDPHVSRRHAQLRLRFGRYTLFDADSQSGVMVNDTPVKEFSLQPGDVIRLGRTQLIYLEDEISTSDTHTELPRSSI